MVEVKQMRIARVETIPIRVPLKPEIAIKSGRGGLHAQSPFLIVKIFTDDGAVGLGEVSCTPRWSGEDQFTAAHFINTSFAPLLVGEMLAGAGDIERLTQKFIFPVSGNYFTKAGVEMALWDLAGKAAGKPVHDLLGGKVRDAVATKWSVSGVAPEKAADIARWAIGLGFKKMKVKVGIDPASDVERVRSVREAVGPQVPLGVDANGGYATPAVAVEAIQKLLAHSIYFAEQPVPDGDAEALAEVRRAIDIPVIADESLYTLTDAKVLARHNACDVFSIYIGKAGGILPALRISEFAQSVNIKCTVGSNLELGVGSAAMTHLALATKAIDPDTYPCDIIGPFYYEDDIVREPLPILPGIARSNGKPGLGVELDEEKIERFRVK